MYSRDELFLRTLECYFCANFPSFNTKKPPRERWNSSSLEYIHYSLYIQDTPKLRNQLNSRFMLIGMTIFVSRCNIHMSNKDVESMLFFDLCISTMTTPLLICVMLSFAGLNYTYPCIMYVHPHLFLNLAHTLQLSLVSPCFVISRFAKMLEAILIRHPTISLINDPRILSIWDDLRQVYL